MLRTDRRVGNSKTRKIIRIFVITALMLMLPSGMTVLGATKRNPPQPTDPGIRGGPAGAGGPIANLCNTRSGSSPCSAAQDWTAVNSNFKQVNNVSGTAPIGLGPRFSSNSCVSCHSQPAAGGSSPSKSNPLFSVYQADNAQNTMPFFEANPGPALEAIFPFQPGTQTPNGLVQPLFTVTGRKDAQGCNISQPAWDAGNLALRNPLPMFGDGFIEILLNSDITNNAAAVCSSNQLGICGTPNLSGNDGSVLRFGWKADVRSLQMAAGFYYQVKMGVTNEMFPNEMDETSGCNPNPIPESSTNFGAGIPDYDYPGDLERFALFMRFLAPPTPGQCPTGGNCTNGQAQFNAVGCNLCHTTSFTTPASSVPCNVTTGAACLSNVTINLYSDLVLHHMGPCLADNVVSGAAQGDMFRTPPLWGAGKRAWFLHDGRTSDIVAAIEDHALTGCGTNFPASEATAVINNFNALSSQNAQDLVDFLRSL